MNIALPEVLKKFVNRQVQSGNYRSAREVVLDALHRLRVETENVRPRNWRRKNERRVELIDKQLDAGLSAGEARELVDLQAEADGIRRRHMKECWEKLAEFEEQLKPRRDAIGSHE